MYRNSGYLQRDESANTSTVQTWYLRGLDLIGQQTGPEWSYFTQDGLGSVRELTDAGGQVRYTSSFDPYGVPVGASGVLSTDKGFTGEPTDPNGLVYLRARYMNPQLGQFLSHDPAEGTLSRMMTRNAYAYAGANPIDYTDHSGRFFWFVAYLAASAALGGLIGAAAAGFDAAASYDWAKQGKCGCDKKTWADHTNRDQFVQQATDQGAVWGAAFGLAAALGPETAVLAAVAGLSMSEYGMISAGMDFLQRLQSGQGASWCDALDFLVNLASGAMSLHGLSPGDEGGGGGAKPPMDPTGPGEGGNGPGVGGGSTGGGGTDNPGSGSGGGNTVGDGGQGGGDNGGSGNGGGDNGGGNDNGGNGEQCSFTPDTLVATDNGETPIGNLKVGDHVLAYNPHTGTTTDFAVDAVLVHTDPVIEDLTIDTETLQTTPEHPFFTADKGFVAAGDLRVGEQIRKADGRFGTVKALKLVAHPQRMYNLTVHIAHTFFVGIGQWLVHNDCQNDGGGGGGFQFPDWLKPYLNRINALLDMAIPKNNPNGQPIDGGGKAISFTPGPAQTGGGVRWIGTLGRNFLRIDPADPNTSVIHVHVQFNGIIVDVNGNVAPSAGADSAHIPLTDWLNWKTWYSPTGTYPRKP